MKFLKNITKENLPVHIAIIMDGNGRWAKKKGNKRIFGHKNGVKAVKQTVEAAGEAGIKYLTLYAFSSENWNRPKIEVDALMTLLISAVKNETENLMNSNVRVKAIGNISALPESVTENLNQIINKTKNNTGLTLILALSYSARNEITNAVKQIASEIVSGKIKPETINENTISDRLYTHNIPDPELLIRTSGEYRLSNFLLWQISYTELYFTDTLWPDFKKEDLFKAIYDFQQRERRFGKTSEQIKAKN
ncbi:MAG: isoprenyl transferase [Bacteroidales bacterium]|nr:isoprenyl transferase [Bacteroidales bacterium]